MLYHNILTRPPPHPINNRCLPVNSTVVYVNVLSDEAKLTLDSIFKIQFMNIC